MPSLDDLTLLDPDGGFRRRLEEDRAAIAQLAVAGPWRELERVVHRLAGAAGTFGYLDLGDVAIACDDAFVAVREAGAPLPSVEGVLGALDRALASSG